MDTSLRKLLSGLSELTAIIISSGSCSILTMVAIAAGRRLSQSPAFFAVQAESPRQGLGFLDFGFSPCFMRQLGKRKNGAWRRKGT